MLKDINILLILIIGIITSYILCNMFSSEHFQRGGGRKKNKKSRGKKGVAPTPIIIPSVDIDLSSAPVPTGPTVLTVSSGPSSGPDTKQLETPQKAVIQTSIAKTQVLKIDPREDSGGRLELWQTNSDNKLIKATLTDDKKCNWEFIKGPSAESGELTHVYDATNSDFITGLGTLIDANGYKIYNCKKECVDGGTNLKTCKKTCNPTTWRQIDDGGRVVGLSYNDQKRGLYGVNTSSNIGNNIQYYTPLAEHKSSSAWVAI